MGLFEKLGRQVEEFKQTAKQTADANADYQCRACGERFHTDQEECPECGATEVVPTQTETKTDTDTDTDAKTAPSTKTDTNTDTDTKTDPKTEE